MGCPQPKKLSVQVFHDSKTLSFPFMSACRRSVHFLWEGTPWRSDGSYLVQAVRRTGDLAEGSRHGRMTGRTWADPAWHILG